MWSIFIFKFRIDDFCIVQYKYTVNTPSGLEKKLDPIIISSIRIRIWWMDGLILFSETSCWIFLNPNAIDSVRIYEYELNDQSGVFFIK